MPRTTPIIITRTIAQHVAHRDAERAAYADDQQLDRTPWEIEDSLERLVRAEGALADALLAMYRPELLAPDPATEIQGLCQGGCNRPLVPGYSRESFANGVCASCTNGGSW